MKNDTINIIAEIGGNFKDYQTAKKLIDDAKESGVDAVKLQTFRAETLASSRAMFNMENTGKISQYEYFKQYEIGEDMHREIFHYAREKGLGILSTPSHEKDVELLEKFSPDVYKIGADDLTNLPFLKNVARYRKPIMLSTGMGTIDEIKRAVDVILTTGNDSITIMHTVSIYPTAPKYVNLEVINTLKREFPQFMIGYSDHTMSVNACLFAAVMGAMVIEKHFTYDKNADGPDHMHSATRDEMKYLVDMIRLFEVMKGNGNKRPVGDEVKNRLNNRKSLVYDRDLEEGHVVVEGDIAIKRPGSGIEPEKQNMIIGRRVSRSVVKDELVLWGDLY